MGRGQILEMVVSGGQTGVDQVALKVARELHYRTGGVAPKGWRTDDGPAPWLADYGLTEHKVSSEYRPRTYENVRIADATVIFDAEADAAGEYAETTGSPGCRLTRRFCQDLNKPYWINPSVSELQDFLIKYEVVILNVAGNRLRTHPESAERAKVVLTGGLIPF